MLLRNAHVTMNGSQFTTYFNIHPPTFEVWISQGPRAKPLPTTSVFSPLYTPPEHDNDHGDNDDNDEDDN